MKQSSFLKRLLVSYLVIAIIPLTLISTIFFYNTTKSVEQASRQRLSSAADQVNSQLDSLLTQMSYISVSLVSNEYFMDAVRQLENSSDAVSQREFYAQIYSEICSYAWFSSMYNVTFFNDAGFLITSYNYNKGYNHTYRMTQEDREAIPWYSQVQDNYGQSVVVPVQQTTVPSRNGSSMSLVRAIRNPGQTVGYLSVDIQEEDLRNLLEMEGTIDADLLVLGGDGTQLCKSDQFPIEAENGKIDPAALEALEKDYFLERRSSAENTQVYMVMSQKTAYKEAYNTLLALGIQTLFLLCLTCVVVVAFIKDLSRPLVALRREMQETTLSNLQDPGNEKLFNRFEEIGYLYQQFHEMRERLDLTMQQEMENQKLYMEERMNYLQAQINPHFMCNTLNVIGIMGSEHGAQNVQDACMQLSSLLRYSIANSENKTTLREEMQNIRDYLQLMQLRYEHKLAYSVTYDTQMQDMPMPRLVLEPFVENIFAHAYGPQHKIIHADVTGWLSEGRWHIQIQDDGQGIPQEHLQLMRDHISESCAQILAGQRVTRKYGIGIENTIMRLCLYYGSSFQFTLDSAAGSGLRIILSADIKKEENYEKNASIDSGR